MANISNPIKEEITGIIEKVTFHNPDNGFCVLKIRVKGHKERVALVGHVTTVSPGEFLHASGTWINDNNYGQQFKADIIETRLPTTKEAIQKYLSSGMVRGIGEHYAKKLIKVFGTQVLDIIANHPERLLQIPGIGKHRAQMISSSWEDQKVVRDIMIFLHKYGVGTSIAIRIHKAWGADAISIITANPYRLAKDIQGIGFESADTIAQKLGIAKTDALRAQAGISYTLTRATEEGHCGLPQTELLQLAEQLLEIPQDKIAEAIASELTEGSVIADTVDEQEFIFLSQLYRSERDIATMLQTLAIGNPSWGKLDMDAAIPWVEKQLDIKLAPSQSNAVRLALNSKITVVTGGPGVGKTTILHIILTILKAKDIKVILCAPTGRAAKRLTESTGKTAKTIHRLLEIDPIAGSFRRNASNKLECDLLIIDELSMVDVQLMRSLLRAVPQEAALIMVGDVDQLPSVGPGQVLADIIDSKALPVVRLNEVFRQAASSKIITNAHRINQGLMPEMSPDSDFYFVECANPDDGMAKLLRVVLNRIPERFGINPLKDIQILSPMNKGGLGVNSLNIALQTRLNPTPKQSINRLGSTFGINDKVMQIENDYDKDVYNGDIGFINAINQDNEELVVNFDNRLIIYNFNELDKLVLAYATTIHKSQGSEYPAIVIPLFMQHYPMLKRNLIYTAVTRGKNLVVIIGQTKALSLAVSGKQTHRRWSKLKEWLV